RAEVAGRIARLLADEGDRVERGQVIAHLDQAEAQVRLARANLEVARARLREGRAGVEMLAAQVRTRIDQTRANLQKARNDLSRMRALFAEGAVAQEQVESAQTALGRMSAIFTGSDRDSI
ncbi:MAG: biotin/lipoyl-binding protein, partial [candidate division NC10 bacterium]|nr:biotin/lipoyl-binding protein [candidate division NC10 bacterium]